MFNTRRILLALGILALATAAQGAEFEIHPSIAVSEEYTDNVFETKTNHVSDYITRALPGLSLRYLAPAFKGDVSYLFDYRHYAKNSRKAEITHNLLANGHLTVVENLLFFEVIDSYQRVSLDVTRDVTRESLFVNQSDRNVVSASPYFVFYPTQRTKVKTGYSFVDTRYTGPSGVSKTDHNGFLEASYEFSPNWFATSGYNFIREVAPIGNFSQHRANGGFRYEYGDKSYLFAQAGNTWINYDNGPRLKNLFWNVGLTHVSDTVTTTFNSGVKYDEDPLANIRQETFVIGSIEKPMSTGLLAFSPYYSEFALTKTNTLETRKYGGVVRGIYDFTSRLSSKVSFTAEKYEQPLLKSYTRRFLVDSGLSYLLAEQLTVSLTYIFVDYYSPGIVADNRQVNRGIIELRKVF